MSSSALNKKKVVIIGNGLGGSALAPKLAKDPKLSVTVITPFTFSEVPLRMTKVIAVGPEEHATNIYPLLKEDNVEYIIGKATELKNQSVTLASGQTLEFDYAVIATGSNIPFFQMDPDINTESARKAQISDLYSKIVAANTIVISGGGAIGSELCADIKIRHPKKRIILVFNEAKPLSRMNPSLSAIADKHLKQIGVELHPNEKVLGFENNEVKLSSGKSLIADLYIPAHASRPNTSFIPNEFLDERGQVKVDEFLSVVGLPNVFALGDVSNRDNNKGLIKIDDQIPTIVGNISAKAVNGALKPHVPGYPMGTATGPLLVALGHDHKDAFGLGPDLPGCLGYCCWFCCCGPPSGKLTASIKSDFNKSVVPKKGQGIHG